MRNGRLGRLISKSPGGDARRSTGDASFGRGLVQFAVAGSHVGGVDFSCHGRPLTRWWLKLPGIFAGKRNVHKLHPDGQGGAASGFFVAEGFLFVVADPHAAGQRR